MHRRAHALTAARGDRQMPAIAPVHARHSRAAARVDHAGPEPTRPRTTACRVAFWPSGTPGLLPLNTVNKAVLPNAPRLRWRGGQPLTAPPLGPHSAGDERGVQIERKQANDAAEFLRTFAAATHHRET